MGRARRRVIDVVLFVILVGAAFLLIESCKSNHSMYSITPTEVVE